MTHSNSQVTEKNDLKLALENCERKYDELQKAVTDYTYTVTIVNGVVTKTTHSQACLGVTGFSADEYDADPYLWLNMIYEEDRNSVLVQISDILAGQDSSVLEHRIYHKDGLDRWVQNTILRRYDKQNRLIAYDGLIRDITERKRAEEALLKSEERYRSLVENINLGVTMIDSDYNILMTNATQGLLFGKAVSEFVGKKCFKEFEKREVVCPHCPGTQAMNTGQPAEVETVSVRGHGTRFNVRIQAFPVFQQDSVASGFIEVVEDITGKKKLEAQLQQAQKMESIGTLAGGIAHDFNNILFPIMGFAEMALDNIHQDSPLRNNIKEIIQGTKRASDLVKQILAFSHQSSKELKPLKVQLVIKEVLKLIRSSIPTTIEIKQYISSKCGYVLADPTQIHQIAVNLMTNAFHAMEDEGGMLEVTLKEVELGIDDLKDQSMTPGAYVCLKVADTGHGMDQSVISRIFEPYFTTKESGKGTGLGLAVVHGIVKSYKGDIRVYSEPGEETAFHVYLPVIKSQFETEKTEAIKPVPRGTERILLVDDEEPIVCMEKQMLERLGYDVTERTSSIEALEAFRASPDKFDLVITDMTMPNMTGVQLALKLLEIRPDIPIIICTGFSTKIDHPKAKEFGIRGFVMKPVVMSELGKKIREVLDQEE